MVSKPKRGNETHSHCTVTVKRQFLMLQRTTLNGITLSQTITDPIKRMILISEWVSTYLQTFNLDLGLVNLDSEYDSINRLKPLSVIPLCGVTGIIIFWLYKPLLSLYSIILQHSHLYIWFWKQYWLLFF